MRSTRALVALLACACVLAPGAPPQSAVAPEVQAALDGIQPSSLRDDLKFIASDELEGRDSPSHGLDLAADYIAAQFRRAGLEPGAGDSYFQNASMLVEEPNYSNFELTLSSGDRQLASTHKDAVFSLTAAVDLKDTPLFKLDLSNEALVQHLTTSQVEGKVAITEIDARWRGRFRAVYGRTFQNSRRPLV